MLDSVTKNRINTARDILVGKVPDPKSQVEQITIALIYKFMDDMDVEAEELGGKRTFFSGEYAKYSWRKIFDPRQSGHELLNLYSEAITKMDTNPGVPKLFRDIFKNAYLPYRDPETLKSFLKIINEFEYTHSEKLGDAFEFLLSILGSQGDAGQFRTPRHIIDFMVAIIDPKKQEVILDPACGTAGFLISSYKHIIKQNSSNYSPEKDHGIATDGNQSVNEVILTTNGYSGDKLTADDRTKLADNMHGYDISPDMVRLSLVNMYLHGVKEPQIFEYDSLTSEDHWNEYSDVILANPPFMSPKGGIRPHKRFSVQSNRSEVLFVDYIAEHLTQDGRAAVIVPEGIIFQSGNAYKQLRKMLVDKYLVGVISLPAGVFNPYSGVKTSILWLDKSLAKKTDKILFVKIENDGFDLGAQRRAIKGNDVPNALMVISQYKEHILLSKVTDIESGTNSSLVTRNEISINGDNNLSGERYILKDNINSDYSLFKLASLYHFVRGVTYTKSDEVDEKGIAILRANNINLTSGNLDLTDIRYINKEVKVKEEQRLLKDDILICTASGSIEHIGKVAFSEDDTKYYFGGFMGVLRANRSKILPRFLFISLKSQKFREYIQVATVGANIRNLKSSMLDSFEIPLPPLSIQEGIIEEINSYQKIIDGARQVVENYKPRIDIDPEWEIVELQSISTKLGDGLHGTPVYSDEGEYYFVNGNNLRENKVTIKQETKRVTIKEYEKYKKDLNNRTILVSINGTLGNVAVYNGEKIVLGKSVCYINLKNDINVRIYLQSSNFVDYAYKEATGSTIKNVSLQSMRTFKISLPPIETQKQIATQIEKEKELVNANRQLTELYEQKIKDRIAKVWGE
jgi:type I restriction enzyme M protein